MATTRPAVVRLGASQITEGTGRSRVRRLCEAVRDSVEAVWRARSRGVGLRGMPRPRFWRWYSSWISLKTATRGLGLNCSATAAISLSRVDLRKARRKRRLCVWALPKRDHLEIMMAHEKMLAMRRITRTAKATGPLL